MAKKQKKETEKKRFTVRDTSCDAEIQTFEANSLEDAMRTVLAFNNLSVTEDKEDEDN